MVSKAHQIRELSEEGLSPAEIASELDTSRSYVYKVRSNSTESEPTEPVSEETVDVETEEQIEDDQEEIFDDDEEIVEDRDLPDPEEDLTEETVEEPDREDLSLDDDGPKTYECGACDSEIEYLDPRCPGCGEKLMWSAIDGGA